MAATYKFEDGILRIWEDPRTQEEDPNIFQPFDPDTGEAWENESVAIAWAEEQIAKKTVVVSSAEPTSPTEETSEPTE